MKHFEDPKCPACGHKMEYVWFMVAVDDEAEWDGEFQCKFCDGFGNPLKVDTCTEFGEVVPEENKKLSIIL